MNLYHQGICRERQLERTAWPEPDSLVSGNSKVNQTFRSLLRFCTHRTAICSRHCYACKGPISWKLPVAKAIAVRQWIATNGVQAAAERMATEIYWRGLFRWMDRGDFDPLTVELANRLARLRHDVVFNAFSRNLDALTALTPSITRIYSIDQTTAHTVSQVPENIRIAYLKVAADETIPERVAVVFPLNHRRRLLGDPRDCSFYRDQRIVCASCRRCF